MMVRDPECAAPHGPERHRFTDIELWQARLMQPIMSVLPVYGAA
jgi:hypothetical protein